MDALVTLDVIVECANKRRKRIYDDDKSLF